MTDPSHIRLPQRARCLSCAYPLNGLPSPLCPECGRRFDPKDPDTFALGARDMRRSRLRSAPWTAVSVYFSSFALTLGVLSITRVLYVIPTPCCFMSLYSLIWPSLLIATGSAVMSIAREKRTVVPTLVILVAVIGIVLFEIGRPR